MEEGLLVVLQGLVAQLWFLIRPSPGASLEEEISASSPGGSFLQGKVSEKGSRRRYPGTWSTARPAEQGGSFPSSAWRRENTHPTVISANTWVCTDSV